MVSANDYPERQRRLIVITGASSGIGAATALRLSKRTDLRLLLHGRDPSRLASVASSCRSTGLALVYEQSSDLTHTDAVPRLINEAARLRPVAGLVNCAGVGYFAHAVQLADFPWDQTIAVNLTVIFQLCRALAPLLIADAVGGNIVNLSSDADSQPFPAAAAYCASKAGLLGLSKVLQNELSPQGLRVCVISPGRVDTRFNGKSPGMRPGALSPDNVAEVIEFALFCSPNIELTEIRLDSLGRYAPLATHGQVPVK